MDTKKLRQKILDLAIHGKLVPQDPNDEPASVLLERIREKKDRLIKEGKIKKTKSTASSDMSHYENVPFEVPEGWSWCTLDELTTSIGDGLHGTPKFDDNGEYYFVNGNNLDGIISIKKETKRTTIDEYTKQGLKFNSQTIFVSINGTLGNIAFYNNEPIVLGKSACYINLLDGISKEYIATILRCQYFLNYCRDTATGSTIKNVPLAAMRAFFIPIPSYQEQLRIVDEVEKLLSLVDLLDENTNELGNAITVARSKILDLAIHGKLVPQDADDESASELLKRINPKAIASCDNPHYAEPYELPHGWTWIQLGKLAVDSADGPFGSNLKKEHYTMSKEVRIIQLSNIGEDGWREENTKYTTFEHLSEISRSEVHSGDIVIAKMMPAGRAITCPNTDAKYVLSSDAVKFVLPEGICNEYILNSINSSVFREQVYDNVQGVTRVRTSLQKLRTYLLPLPPYSEQLRIVRKVNELFTQLDMIEKSLQA